MAAPSLHHHCRGRPHAGPAAQLHGHRAAGRRRRGGSGPARSVQPDRDDGVALLDGRATERGSLTIPGADELRSASQLLEELRSGAIWEQCKLAFPKAPWGPNNILQVVTGEMAVAALLAAVALAAPQLVTPLPAAVPGGAAGEELLRLAALRHVGQEAVLLAATLAVLWAGLRGTGARSKGMFSFRMTSGSAVAVAGVCAVLFPLTDPLLASAWRPLVEAAQQAGGLAAAAAGMPSAYVQAVQGCVAAGDGTSLALHALASGLVGPFWEETFWRGFFLASLAKVLPPGMSVAASSVLFAALHLSPASFLPVLLLSAACDVLALRTASLAPPLALHAAWNLYQVALVALGKDSFV